MSEYVGLDVSLEETAVCVIGAAGEVIAEAKVLSEPEAIAAYVKRRAPRAVKVGLETGSLSPWLHRGLCAAGLPALCIDARRVAAYAQADPAAHRPGDAGRPVPRGPRQKRSKPARPAAAGEPPDRSHSVMGLAR